MGLKKFYYYLEDKYYDFVEKTGIYKVTDKIDKVMPSFVLCILLMVILIAGLILLIVPNGGAGDSVSIQFKVIDAESGTFLENLSLVVTTTNDMTSINTNADGLTDEFRVLKNSSYQIDIAEDGYDTFNEFFFSEDNDETVTLALEPIRLTPETVSYSFSAIDSQTNQVVNKSGSVSFKCLNSVIAPSPKSFSNGLIVVDASPECTLTIDSITFDGYLSKYNFAINDNTSTIILDPQEINFGDTDDLKLVFNVANSLGATLSNIKINLTNNFGTIDTCTTSSTGNCTIENLASGEYIANFSDVRIIPIYSSQSQTYYLSESSTKNIVLNSDVKGYISVRIIGSNVSISNAEVSLKSEINNVIETKYSDVNGYVLFTVPEIRDYNVVVDAEGYLIQRKLVFASSTIPSNPIVIPLTLITPATLQPLNVRVITWDGKGFKFAKVVLYDAETGFLTDYKPALANYDGNVVIDISSGKYIAKAVKGSTVGESAEFEFNVKYPNNTGVINIPMGINESSLKVTVVDKDDNPVPYARVDVYDRFSYYNFMPAIPIKSELTNSQGTMEFFLDADNDYYVVASPGIEGDYGKTQSRFIRVTATNNAELNVTLFSQNSSNTKPRMVFVGIYKEGQEVKDNLTAGTDYEVRYNFLVPQNRTGDDSFDEIGFMLRTGTSSMIENDNIFIKNIDVPYIDSVLKYTQFNLNAPHESEGFSDDDSSTEGNSKWVQATLKKGPIDYSGILGFYNSYEIAATINVKDIAAFGEEIKIFALGYGFNNNDDYETYSEYLGPNENVEYYDVYESMTYGVGDELICSTDFCFSSNIVDTLDDLRYEVTDGFGAKPNKKYKYTFTLTNNSPESRYLSSRFILENIDEGLDFKNIKIILPNGGVYEESNPIAYEFDIGITQLLQRQKVTGEITFMPKLKGTRNLSIKFISDQKIKFVNQLFIDVSSDKTFKVTVDPQIIPSGKNFNLLIKEKDASTLLPVRDATVTIKDKFKDIIKGPLPIPVTGEITVSQIPAQGPNDVIYVYVTSPEYETSITDMKATDKLFKITPKKLAYSLNIFNEKQKTENFTISNISPIDLTIESLEIKGKNLTVVDVLSINNDLLNSVGTVVKGFDTLSDFPDNTDSSKQIPLKISLNPRAETISEVQNLSSRLSIVLASGDNKWVTEIPITINIGFDGMLDNANCLAVSNTFWKEVSLDKPVETTFMINNTCTINGKNMPLSGGLEARVLFESNPQGKFVVSIDNRFVELTHGNYRNLLDTFDRDRSYPVILKYEPIGRMKGTVKGTIQFRSLNSTGTGNQELLTEVAFEIDVTNLRDCAVFSKNTLNVGQIADEFTIENKACPTDITYRLSCDDCKGLIVTPRNEITVPASGTSENVTVKSMGATPGAYILNVYSGMTDSRQTENLIKKIKVYVRPQDYCIDLERYEFDLYRSDYSENTGLMMNAAAYDTTNIINLCYGTEVNGTFKVADNAKWQMAFVSFLRDGLLSGTLSALLQGKLFSSSKDKAQSLLDSVEKSTDSKVIAAAAFLKTAIATGDKGEIKEASVALETALKNSDASGVNSVTSNPQNIDEKALVKKVDTFVETYTSPTTIRKNGELVFTNSTSSEYKDWIDLNELNQKLKDALAGTDIAVRDSAYDSLKSAFDKFKSDYPSTDPVTPNNSSTYTVDVVTDGYSVNGTSYLAASYEADNNWIAFATKANSLKDKESITVAENTELNSLIAKLVSKSPAAQTFDAVEIVLASAESMSFSGTNYSASEYTENSWNSAMGAYNNAATKFNTSSKLQDNLDVYKNEAAVALNLLEVLDNTSETCDASFSIKPNGDKYVYRCDGTDRARGCQIETGKVFATFNACSNTSHGVYEPCCSYK